MNKTHKTKIGNISHWTIQLAFRNQLIVAGGAVSFQFLYKLPSQPFRKALQIFVFKTSFICTSFIYFDDNFQLAVTTNYY